MGHPETAEPRDRHGLIRGISIVDRAHMEVGSTHVGDPGLLHWFYAPHSAHQEGWLGTCVPVWGFTLPSILHPGLSAGILRGDSAEVLDRRPYLHLLPVLHPGLSAGILRGDSPGAMDRWPYLYLLPVLHPGLSAGILRGETAGRWTGGPICISSQSCTQASQLAS